MPNAPASTAPKPREVTCFHEAGHGVTGVVLFGGITGARINPDGTGLVWRGPTPKPDANPKHEEKWREKFSDNENMLFEIGPIPPAIVSQHIAQWRNEAIIALGWSERLKGWRLVLTIIATEFRSVVRKDIYPPLFGLACRRQSFTRSLQSRSADDLGKALARRRSDCTRTRS